MSFVFAHNLSYRLFALGILTFCLILVSRTGGNFSLVSSSDTSAASGGTQEPIITVEPQADSPLAITSAASAGRMGPDSQFVEFGFYLVNVSAKPVRAYAIRQDILVDGIKQGGGVSLHNRQLSNSVLRPSQSIFIGGTSNVAADKKTIISLAVDFVEFSDGTKWGVDSTRSSERAAGQRLAAYMITQRLSQILSAGKAEDVLNAVDSGMANLEPPADLSLDLKAGFQSGRGSILDRLKRSKEKGGLKELERELRRLGETFKSKD
jgi:hypothetical protein